MRQRIEPIVYKGRKPRIGIFDDDDATVDMLTRFFTHHGFEVIPASRGQQAIARIMSTPKGERPDLIILDIMMPDIDGFDVASKIRQIDPVIPIIMFSARVDQQDKIRGLMTGAHRYLTKPASPMKLLGEAVKLLGISESQVDLERQPSESDTVDVAPNELPRSIRDIQRQRDPDDHDKHETKDVSENDTVDTHTDADETRHGTHRSTRHATRDGTRDGTRDDDTDMGDDEETRLDGNR